MVRLFADPISNPFTFSPCPSRQKEGQKKKDTGKNEKRERRGRRGKKIKRGCKRKANRKIRTNRIIRKAFAFSSTNFNSIDPSQRLVAEIGPISSDFFLDSMKAETRRHAPFSPLFSLPPSPSLCLFRAIRSPQQLFRSGPLFLISLDPIFSKYLLSVFFEAAPPGRREIEQRWKILIIPPRAFPSLSSFAQGRDNCARFHGKIDNHSGIGNTKIHPRSL